MHDANEQVITSPMSLAIQNYNDASHSEDL